jgi:RimJ/RimL family protein N-acetyltransferase
MARFTPRRILAAIARRLWHRRELYIYACSAERIRALPHPTRLRRDHWPDLLACDAWSYDHMPRGQYLGIIDERQRSGLHHLYSLVENGSLVHYGWITSRQERAPDAALGLVFTPPAKSAALWDFFTHPAARGRGLYGDSLRQCMHDAVELDGARHVFIYVYSDNAVSRRTIEKVGFDYWGSLVMERRLFRTNRYATSTGRSLDVKLLPEETPARVIPVGTALRANG